MSRKIGLIVASAVLLLGGASSAAAGILGRTEEQFRALVDQTTSAASLSQAMAILDAVAVHVRDSYVDVIGLDQMENAAIAGMMRIGPRPRATDATHLFEAAVGGLMTSLDPHSAYMAPAAYREMQTDTAGRFGGIGLSVSQEGTDIKVVSPLEGTPADRAGIRAGDVITHIDGASVGGWSLAQAVGKMRGAEGTQLRLGLNRQGRTFETTLKREIITIQTVRWRREGSLGYIRITSFNQETPAKVAEAFAQLWAQPNAAPEGFIVDLRSNPGGLYSSALAVADHFVDQGIIVTMRDRKGDVQTGTATPGDLSRGRPLAILIDNGTASGAELTAAALRSLRRAVVLGARSFGKGSVQTIQPLANGGAIRLTTARYFSDMGTTFDGAGIEPDVAAPGKPGDGDDAALRQAINMLTRPAVAGPAASGGPLSAAAMPSLPRRSAVGGFPQGQPRPDDIAVVIGNADYGKLGRDLPNVVPAYADAEGIKRYVTQALGIREGNIIDLRDATGAQMQRVFGTETNHKGQLYDWVRPDRSRVFVYYAGHGAPAGPEGLAYLIPSDADAARIELNGYPLSTLYANLGKLPAESVTVVLESCFSGVSQAGSVIARASAVFVKPRTAVVPRNITVITAGMPEQMASWEQDGSQSLFTGYYLKAMAGEADRRPYGNGDGTVSPNELDAYLKDTLTYYARRYYGRDQTAQIVVGQ